MPLNFLADESCDFGIVRALRENRHDVLAVCVPRSEHFRRLAAQSSQTEGAHRLRLHVLTVERYTGAINCLEPILHPE